ncbi:hypothetical protein B0I35DRAFT_181732 [Stachybotrys elegans]|uniref:Uncharacterized protein n=1 Tax=Stachybotrys elegans TaxID=80388 RepID=A0A8K0WIS5_9HYPO|nr:hypothetical protein B0I35DRAFT_181732 [Stachybotrys elegans]
MTFLDWNLVESTGSELPVLGNTSCGLWVHAATFGGVIVTEKIRELCAQDGTMDIEMDRMVHFLSPDPHYGRIKTLTVLYQFEGDESLYVLNAPETFGSIHISRTGRLRTAIQRLESPYKIVAFPDVEIVAAIWGLKRMKTRSVLLDLIRFFSDKDEQGAIRMTNEFWKEDTWNGQAKTWSIYFRFTGSDKIQCVTGWEQQALEVPWCRHV